MRAILRWSSTSLEGVPHEGRLGPSIAFALLATSIYLAGSTLLIGLVTWWEITDGMARFGEHGAVPRLLALSTCLDRIGGAWVSTLTRELVLVPALVLATRLFAAPIPPRKAAHAVAYLCAWLVIAWIPGLAWLALFGVPVALRGWLVRDAGVPDTRATMTTAAGLALAWLAGLAVDLATSDLRHDLLWPIADWLWPSL